VSKEDLAGRVCLFIGSMALFAAVDLFTVAFFLISAFVGSMIVWSWGDVRYEVTDCVLRLRAGPQRVDWRIEEVAAVELPGYLAGRLRMTMTSQLINRWSRPVLLVNRDGRQLLISPTNPEEMRDEILRRRDALRGGSNA
jgi:hypothetical protein